MPLLVKVISPLAASVIVISDEALPLFVFKIKSPVPLLVTVTAALRSPHWTVSANKLTLPVPKGVTLISILLSVVLVEIAERIGPEPVAAFVILNSLTAVLAAPKTKASSQFASAIKPPSANLGAVKVLFDKVVVEVAVTKADVASTMSGFVPSLAVA